MADTQTQLVPDESTFQPLHQDVSAPAQAKPVPFAVPSNLIPDESSFQPLHAGAGTPAGTLTVSAAQPPTPENPAAKHGLLHRAWDWVNTPVFDNVLPDGIKTSD